MVCNLHASSWVAYGSLESAIIVKVGGRQGCVFGSMVFNTPYTLALMALNDELVSKGIVMHIHDGSISCEASGFLRESAHHVLDVTFVDDECIMLEADDSNSLETAIDCCTLVLSTTFQLLKLEINWRQGKTLCMSESTVETSWRNGDVMMVASASLCHRVT